MYAIVLHRIRENNLRFSCNKKGFNFAIAQKSCENWQENVYLYLEPYTKIDQYECRKCV